MWNNKRESEAASYSPVPMSPVSSVPGGAERAAIGASVAIVGNVTGAEDLTVLGKLEGKIDVPQHSVTIGRSARVQADIHAKSVSVEGEVRGNLFAGEQILIRKTATMLGNLTAPRVGLEDGCCFKGSVDMEMRADAPRAAASPAPRPFETPAKPPAPASPAPVKLETAPARP
jgi:cytoskeletal protein CcmA (bactofilin family)